jgi:hypothetical protein
LLRLSYARSRLSHPRRAADHTPSTSLHPHATPAPRGAGAMRANCVVRPQTDEPGTTPLAAQGACTAWTLLERSPRFGNVLRGGGAPEVGGSPKARRGEAHGTGRAEQGTRCQPERPGTSRWNSHRGEGGSLGSRCDPARQPQDHAEERAVRRMKSLGERTSASSCRARELPEPARGRYVQRWDRRALRGTGHQFAGSHNGWFARRGRATNAGRSGAVRGSAVE